MLRLHLLCACVVTIFISAGCAVMPSELTDSSSFTFSTYDGGIYRVDTSGQRQQIIHANNSLKEDLKWSPDRTRLAYVTSELAQDGLRHTLWVVSSDGGNSHFLFGPARALQYSWEKDGLKVYLEEAVTFDRIPFDKDTTIKAYEIDAKTGDVQAVVRKTNLFPLPRRSPDGKLAAWTDPTDGKWTLYLLDSEGNKLSTIYQPPPDQVTNGVWSPDSQLLAILRDNEIYLYSIATSSWSQVSSLASNHDGYLVTDIQWSPDGKWLSYMINDRKLINGICILNIAERAEKCFDAKWSSNEHVWDQNSRYVTYLGKTPAEEADIFAIDVQEGTIKNLTQDGNNAIETWIAH